MSRLSTKLIVCILILAVPIFVLSLGILFTQSRHFVRQEALGRANSVLNATLQRVCNHIFAVETATNANSWLAEEYMQPDSLLDITHRIVRLNSHIDGCSISMEPNSFPQQGRYFSAYTVRKGDTITTVVENEYDYFSKLWYKTPRQLEEPCWVVYYDESDSLALTLEGMIASYSKPLYDAEGHFAGIISTDLSLLRLSKIINAERPYPNSYFMMVDKEGRFYIHPDPKRLFTSTIFDIENHGDNSATDNQLIALGHEMTKANQGSMHLPINGQPCLVCYQPVPGTTWSLALVSPDSDTLQGYNRLTLILVPLLVIGLFVILLFTRRSVNHAMRPLKELLAQTQSIAAGNYDVQIPSSHRKDAVGRLQNSFAKMLKSLNYHIASVHDTVEQTERRNEELAQATLMVEESDRQKVAFIHNVTHQIHTPLNIIMGFAQLLPDMLASPSGESAPAAPPAEITGLMEYNASLLNRMLLMLFDSSDTGLTEELNCPKHDHVSCNDVAREAINFVKLHYPDLNIKFLSLLPDEFSILTNRVYLMRSIREVIYNAAKYSDGKNVTITVKPTADTILFIIQDTGKGIAPADRERLFMFFTKVDDLSEGLGLGLPLSKRHASNLGGDLTLDTDYHDGCRFIIEIPKTAS